ncbi:MAG TPA: response regulator [Polyangiaceae bacterium]|jgi:DNA-binding response OmpR family regulator|nr:response regulator [Polyangiaceae bacterium]
MTKVLLVDDDESNRVTMSVLLEEEGFDVKVAASLAEAESMLVAAGSEYDLFLLDHSLGDGFGTALIPEIRKRFPSAKVVAMSGSAGSELMMMKADAAVTKGLHFPEFLERLRAIGSTATRGSR